MKEQKIIFRISLTISVISLLCGFIGEYKLDKYIHLIINLLMGHRDFYVNLSLGIFTGASFSAVVSLISYYNNKQKTLYEYWLSLDKHFQALTLFGNTYFSYSEQTDECIKRIQSSEQILSDISMMQNSYSDLAKIRKELSIFDQKSKLEKLISETFQMAGRINIELTRIAFIKLFRELSQEKKRIYCNQFVMGDSIDKFRDSVRELQTLCGFEIKRLNLEEEGIHVPANFR